MRSHTPGPLESQRSDERYGSVRSLRRAKERCATSTTRFRRLLLTLSEPPPPLACLYMYSSVHVPFHLGCLREQARKRPNAREGRREPESQSHRRQKKLAARKPRGLPRGKFRGT